MNRHYTIKKALREGSNYSIIIIFFICKLCIYDCKLCISYWM